MTVWLLLLHLLNFVLPALAMALLMPWAGRWVMESLGMAQREPLWEETSPRMISTPRSRRGAWRGALARTLAMIAPHLPAPVA